MLNAFFISSNVYWIINILSLQENNSNRVGKLTICCYLPNVWFHFKMLWERKIYSAKTNSVMISIISFLCHFYWLEVGKGSCVVTWKCYIIINIVKNIFLQILLLINLIFQWILVSQPFTFSVFSLILNLSSNFHSNFTYILILCCFLYIFWLFYQNVKFLE